MKSYRGSGGLAPLVLNLVTSWGCVVGLTPRALCHRERTPYALNRGWFFPRTDMNILDKRKTCCLHRNSNSGPPNLQPCRYNYYAIPASLPDYTALHSTRRQSYFIDFLVLFAKCVRRLRKANGPNRFLYRQRARLVFWRRIVLIYVIF